MLLICQIADLRSRISDRIMFLACWLAAKGSPFSALSPFQSSQAFGPPIVSLRAATALPRIRENLFDLLGLAIGCLTPN